MLNHFLRSLPAADFAALEKHLYPVEVKAGVNLYEAEDAVDWVYFPTAGLVSLISVMRSGEQVEVAMIGREGVVGSLEAAGAGIIFYRAAVQAPLHALRAPARAYVAVFDASPSLRRIAANHVELMVAEARQTIACHTHHPVERRMAWWLLECQDRTGEARLPLTQEFLAAMLGVQRTSVTGVALALKQAGLIRYSRGVITILDRPGLEARSCECYATNRHYRSLIEGAGRGEAAPAAASGTTGTAHATV
jgi:CRP-like cAMP-binding protein